MTPARQPGDRVGAYELVQVLGAGGMGEVWEAVFHGPAGFRKQVAVKLLHGSPTERDVALLVREARLGARLQHPNIVGVLGLGEVGGSWYVVMELVRGPSAGQLLREGPLAPGLVVDIGIQAANGLAHLHGLVIDDRAAGMVHCDVKPENLLVDEFGVVKLADLGIAALSGERAMTAGTLGFMAPEQLDGRPEARSDLFGLGATLYVLATGKRPFERTLRGLAGLERQLSEPAFAGAVDARIPGLGDLLVRCLRQDPASRWPDARTLHGALSKLRALLPVTAVSDGGTLLRAPPPSSVPTSPSAGPGSGRGNVVAPRDRFVGREADLRRVDGHLREGERLVTLLATGGTGKTRLATEVALRAADDFDGGTWVVELADARSVDEVCRAIAAQLGVPLGSGSPVDQIGAVLAARGEALILLDNLEQCVEAMRTLVPTWMGQAPEARFLATSRIPLKVRGERPVALDALGVDEAVQLFRERAPVAVPTAHEAELAALCEELGGLPLAVELAAARLRSMSVPQMRQRMGLRLLAGGGSELPDRHRSLEASIRWSWDLLDGPARAALQQLSVFVGGCSLAGAEAVLDERALGPDGWAIDRIQELVEASLLRVDAEGDRVQVPGVVQAFASARAEPREREAAMARHAAFFAQLGAAGALERLDVARVLPDTDNVVAATRTAIRQRDRALVPALVRTAVALLDRTGPLALANELVSAALAVPDLPAADRVSLTLSAARAALVTGRPAEARAALASVGGAVEDVADPVVLAIWASTVALEHRIAGRPDAAAAAFDRALALLERAGDPRALARVLSSRGGLDHELGRHAEARRWFERSLRLRRQAGDRHGEAMDRANLAHVANSEGRTEEALAHQQTALALYREAGDARGVAQTLGDLGLTLGYLDRAAEAEEHLRTALQQHRKLGNRRFEGLACSNLGSLLRKQGRLDEAVAVLRDAIRLHRASGNRRSEGIALQWLAEAVADAGDTADAEVLLEEALGIHRSVQNRSFLASATLLRGDLRERRGDRDGAEAAYAAAAAAYTELGDAKGLQKVAERRGRG